MELAEWTAVESVCGHGDLVPRALALHESGDLEGAGRLFLQALDRQPDNVELLCGAGTWAAQIREFALAAQLLGKACLLDPRRAMTRNLLGSVQLELDQHEAALENFELATRITPDSSMAWSNRALALAQLGRHQEAVETYGRVIQMVPGDATAWYNRGCSLMQLGRTLSCSQPFVRAAIEDFSRAVRLDPAYARAWYNRGIALDEVHELHAAVESFDKAIANEPDHSGAHWNQAICCLRQGDWDRGWEKHEWRWRHRPEGTDPRRAMTAPLWLGKEPLHGKTILVPDEQGLGDTLQFCRYVPLLIELGARVIVGTTPYMQPVLARLEGRFELVTQASQLPPIDFYCPMMSLPLAFGTRPGTVPSPRGYLGADPAKVARWRQTLGERRKLRVGLAWSGNPIHQNDHNRSMLLAQLAPLLNDGIEFVSLQKEMRETDRQALEHLRGLIHFGDALKDFTDTAALCELMDVVLCVDTSVAHLAGALGKPVWIMLPFHPDWRWMLGRTDSPWYAHARLFRQPREGDWTSVVSDVGSALRTLKREQACDACV